MTDQGYRELADDARKVGIRITSAIEAEDWIAVSRLCDRLDEMTGRLYHHARTQAALARVREMAAPPPEREQR